MIDAITTVITALFGIGNTVQNIISSIQQQHQKTEAVKDKILYETWINMSLILEDYLEDNADAHKIIEKLRIKDLEHAINHGYDFNNIKRGRIPKNMVSTVGFLEPYIGYDCKGVLNNIRLHIEKLQLLPSIHSSKSLKKIDIRKRLINIGKRYLLFTRFIT